MSKLLWTKKNNEEEFENIEKDTKNLNLGRFESLIKILKVFCIVSKFGGD